MDILVPDSSLATIAAHPIDTLRAASAVPEALAQKLAAEHYGLIAAVHRLDSERDQNFRLRSLSGREYVLKIANPTCRRRPCSISLPRTPACRSRASFRRGTA